MLNSVPPEWMQWTTGTIIFLGTIILLLTGFTIWDMKDPGWGREGSLLPIATTRGDRFFMGLLMTGIYFCLLLTFFGSSAAWTVIVAGVLFIAGAINFF